LKIQLLRLGAVGDEQVGDVVALARAGEVESVGEFLLGPTAGAKEFFDHGVESGVDSFFEQGEVLARTDGYANASAGSEPLLERKELPFVDEVQELFEVFGHP
jgi:hypothetical protein